MIGYNPSHLNKNETLLEAFHRVEAYLKANPQYQVYQSSATYQQGTQEYALNTIVVPEGSTVGKGDVVLFSNVYYAVITAVSETTFSVQTATNFRGVQGEQGPKGDTGATGAKGETGLPALMYSKNVIMGPYTSFSTDLDGYNRPPQINDSCLYVSSNTDTIVFGIIDEIRPDTQQVFVRKESFIETKGQRGETGPKGENGEDGISTLLYAGELSESVTTAEIAQVTMPTDRVIQVYDILISTSPNTFGAMAQVTELGQTTATVNFIGTLQSESGGGTTLNKYTLTLDLTQTVSSADSKRLRNILLSAKGRVMGNMIVFSSNYGVQPSEGNNPNLSGAHVTYDGTRYSVIYIYVLAGEMVLSISGYNMRSSNDADTYNRDNNNPSNSPFKTLKVIYFNDTEIT